MIRTAANFFIFLAVAASLTGNANAFEQSGFTVIEDRTTLPLLDPTFSERKTLKIRLNNGLEALLVSDPLTDKSAATLVVKAGWWEDPQDATGIAHFLEHMLFLGTKKYPGEMDYDRFISEHGGSMNAFTSTNATAYLFTIENSVFPEALDRFSSFFKEPLFNPSGVDRELTAIDQEYAKNVENDNIRAYYVLKELGNPDHPHHSFGMGNREALKGVSQDTLKQWYREHYSANRMVLEVISPLPLEQLEQLVVEEFGGIENKNLAPLQVDLPFFTSAIKGHMITIEPVMNGRSIGIFWEIPKRFVEMTDSKPELIICNILGHEGEQSLMDQLKSEKLADGIQCGKERLGDNAYILYVEISLTDAGVKEVNKVALRLFEAVANLKEKELPDYLYAELKTMTDLAYQYQTRQESFQNIMTESQLLSLENLAAYPENLQTIKSFDRSAVRELLSFMTPANAVFILSAPKKLAGVEFDRKEKWLGAAYSIKPISEKTLSLWNSAVSNPKIDLPAPNPYIPENTAVFQTTASINGHDGIAIPTPSLVFDNDKGKVYAAQDALFHTPTISWNIYIKTPAIDASDIKKNMLGAIYARYAADILAHYIYPASQAGLNFSLQSKVNGIAVSIDGYSDKADDLLLDMVRAMKELKPREQKFKVQKERLIRDYEDQLVESPLMQAFDLLANIIYKDRALSKTNLAALKKITFDDFSDFCNEVFAKTYIQGILYGNTTEAKAKNLTDRLNSALESMPYPVEDQYKIEVINLPADKGPFYIEAKSKVQGNAALLAIETLPYSLENRAIQQIAMQAIKEPFFTSLRTKQQTAYLVYSDAMDFDKNLFSLFSVQSNTHDPRDLLSRFELSIEEFVQEIDKGGVTEEKFENIRQSQIMTLKYPVHNMQEMGALLFNLLVDYDGDFGRIAKRIDSFEQLSYQKFVEGVKQEFGKRNKHRLAVLFSGTIPEDGTLKYTRLCNNAQMRGKLTYCRGEEEADSE